MDSKNNQYKPEDIEPINVSKNLTVSIKKCCPDEAWLLTDDIVLQ